ncbi:MAG: alpha/beta hydrolase family protein [Alkalispirochaeta sp.]
MTTHDPDSPYRPAAHARLDPQHVHEQLMSQAPRRLAFRDQDNLNAWRSALHHHLLECIGALPEAAPLNPQWSEEETRGALRLRRVEFTVELEARAVGWLITPASSDSGMHDSTATPRPTIICVQGHSSGGHLSFGETRYPGDEASLAEDRDYAVQAVRRGYTAFVLEQRAFGERMDSRPPEQRGHYDYTDPFTDERCRHQAMVALLLGRTLLGERVSDVSRSLDLLETLPEVDPSRIACMGNSGGGTVSYYAACLDSRIAAVMPSCAVCTYQSSIGRIDHCCDNYLPGALEYFDMADLAGLIAPRPLVVVAGRRDPIYPYEGVTESVATIRRIYRRFEEAEPRRLAFYTGEGGHRFYADAWDQFRAVTGW